MTKCQYSFQFRPTSYIWEKKDGELPPTAKVDVSFLHFETLNKSDNGVYLCLAENSIGNSEEEYILRVQGTHSRRQVRACVVQTDGLVEKNISSFYASSLFFFD